jgi:hypothetical protein
MLKCQWFANKNLFFNCLLAQNTAANVIFAVSEKICVSIMLKLFGKNP